MKMDLEIQDLEQMDTVHDPHQAIRLLYSNALNRIIKLLKPHLHEVKDAADTYLRLGLHEIKGPMKVSSIQAAESISDLFNQMSVKEAWDSTRFLQQAVDAIPYKAVEREVAVAILSHYKLHLAIFKRATLLKDYLAKRKDAESEDGSKAILAKKMVPLELTSSKAYSKFTCEDCHRLQVRVISAFYGIPEEKIICQSVEERHSTTVTFLIPGHYIQVIMQHSSQLDTVWVLLELDVIEVAIPGVFVLIPSLRCFLAMLRGCKNFTADLLGVTEVGLCYLMALMHGETKALTVSR